MKVFLGGTCNNSTWREYFINHLKIDSFNPVVDDWTPECQEEEYVQKDKKCTIHLYVITNKMTGVFSIAEVLDSVHTKGKITILQVRPFGFTDGQLKSLQAVVDLVKLRGGIAYVNNDLDRTVTLLNTIGGK